MDDVDRQRAVLFEWRAITNWNHWFQLREQGLMPDAQWNELIWLIQNLGRRPALREAWDVFKGDYDESFREFVSRHFEEGDRGRASAAASTGSV